MPKLERFPQSTPATPGAGRTAAAQRAPRCLHVRSNGTRCGSPALAQRDLCYFYNAVRDRYRGLPLIEDATSIQVAVIRVLQLITTGAANYKETGLMLYALQIAAQNLRSVRGEQALAADIVRYDPQDRDQLRDYQALLASGALTEEEGDSGSAANAQPSAGFVSGHDLSRADQDGAETPRARESAPSGRTERASRDAAETVDASEELSSEDVARALNGAPTEEQRELAVAREELRLRLAQQREERKR